MSRRTAGDIGKTCRLEKVLNFVFCPNSAQLFSVVCSCNMVRGSRFRLLYRVVFFCFCLSFAYFYPHGGGSEYGRREGKTESRKIKREFKSKPLKPAFRLHTTKRQSNDSGIVSSLKTRSLHFDDVKGKVKREKFALLTTQHLRTRRDAISENKNSSIKCVVNITIKYEDQYKVWNNFSMMYRGRMYHYHEYRVTDDGLQVCNSSELPIQLKWWYFIAHEKRMMAHKHCNVTVDGFFLANYTLYKNFTVFFKPTQQSFTKGDYVVVFGRFAICSAKLSLSCNDDLLDVKYGEQYLVFKNFSLFHKNKMYDYREYRFSHDSLKMCASKDPKVQAIWKIRNSWEKYEHLYKCRVGHHHYPDTLYYAVDNQFTVYWARSGRHLPRSNYAVVDGKPHRCLIHEPKSIEYTQEDLLMCNDSIINIKYDDEYKVWNNFSILCKNKMYDYTEYRVLNDGIKICNSTDNYVRNIWKLRNDWVKRWMHYKSCDKGELVFQFFKYTVDKQFTVYSPTTGQYFTRNEYGVIDESYANVILCQKKLGNQTTEYTQKDLQMCNDSIINIKYDDEYKVWNNFSILYKDKMYNHTEYRVLNDGIKICNSTNNNVRNIWSLRNAWVKDERHSDSCVKDDLLSQFYNYAVNKQFTVYLSTASQYLKRNDYGIREADLVICRHQLRPHSIEYSEEDLQMCNDSIINIEYDDEYTVWNNFSILFKNKVYDDTEYRVLNDGIKICNSTDDYERNFWKLRNMWVKSRMHFKDCKKPITYVEYHQEKYTVRNNFRVLIHKTDQVIPKYDYGVFQGKLIICNEKLFSYTINIKTIIAPLCALAISFISLLLLLIVYCILPELRTLPGLNLMSLTFAFLLWQTYLVVFLSMYSRVGSLLTTPCARLFVTTKFLTYSILMNAAVNIYHLRKTFCGNTLVKSDVNKWKRFLRYSFFSWGIPVIVSVVYIVLVKAGALRLDQYISFVRKDGLRFDERIVYGKERTKDDDVRIYQHISGDCINGRISPDWSVDVDVYGLQGCLLLYIIVMFIFTAYRIRKKLKASSNIAQKSNIRKNHKFLILLKLSTTTALSYWLPLFISRLMELNFDVKIALYTVTLLTGAYIGIAFVFTRRNYTLLRKKYSPAKQKSVSKIGPA